LRDVQKVERLALVYALAGAALFDVAAEPEVVEAAAKGLKAARELFLQPPAWLQTAYGHDAFPRSAMTLMVSHTLEGDRHTQIAVVEEPLCIFCDKCTEICPPGSIVNGVVDTLICTGCMLCVSICPPRCIAMVPRETKPDLAACWEAGARAREIHTGAANGAELAACKPLTNDWQKRGGLLSYSIDGRQLGHKRAVALALEVGGPEIIIQADGKPISGTVGDLSTIPALRLARAMARAQVPGFIQPAGGTNDRTGHLALRHGISLAGVGVGSFARQQVKIIEDGASDSFSWLQAVQSAKALVNSITPQSAHIS
jgi:Pyruvate/2-oxoacid:ferredoxin oxidoreductase delta subunit